jgi:hypothetical protein
MEGFEGMYSLSRDGAPSRAECIDPTRSSWAAKVGMIFELGATCRGRIKHKTTLSAAVINLAVRAGASR